MKPVAVAVAGVGVVVLSLVAAAMAAPPTQGAFHGLQILANSGTELSGETKESLSGETKESNVRTLGPYPSDAVVFLTWTGEVSYAGSQGLAEPQVTVRYDGAVVQAKDSRMTVEGPGPSAFRVIDGDRIFLRKGEARTVSLVVEDGGKLEGEPARAVARLNTLAIAAPG